LEGQQISVNTVKSSFATFIFSSSVSKRKPGTLSVITEGLNMGIVWGTDTMNVTTLTLHVGASGPIQAWRVVTCDELETLAVQTRVLVSTVALKLAQAIDARSTMLAWVGSAFININITSGQMENNKLQLLIYYETHSTASRLSLGPTQPPTQ
jgi:hypothetical protein